MPAEPSGYTPAFEILAGRRCFTARWHSPGEVRANIVVCQAFADEASLCRRMLRLFAERAAHSGIQTHLADCSGTGDSEGDLSQASVQAWLSEMESFARPLAMPNAPPLYLLGVRLGVALALELASRIDSLAAVAGWAPVFDGASQVRQLTRLASVSRNTAQAAAGPAQQWAAGEAAVVGGMTISAELVASLQALNPTGSPTGSLELELFEVRAASGDTDVSVSPGLSKRLARLTQAGWSAQASAVPGAAFWNVPDPVDCLPLLDQTIRWIDSRQDAAAQSHP